MKVKPYQVKVDGETYHLRPLSNRDIQFMKQKPTEEQLPFAVWRAVVDEQGHAIFEGVDEVLDFDARISGALGAIIISEVNREPDIEAPFAVKSLSTQLAEVSA